MNSEPITVSESWDKVLTQITEDVCETFGFGETVEDYIVGSILGAITEAGIDVSKEISP